jgi:hypothetical protein
MKYYYKLFLIKIMAFFGIKFTKFCAKIPRLKNIAYLMLYEQTASTAMPPHGTILQYDHIQPIELTNKNFTDVVFAQFDKHLNYAGLRVALIAHWDPQRIIDPYVFYYARHLKEIGYSTILCSADEIKELDNSKNILDAVIYRGNEGYDYSSWKSAF